MCLDKCLDRIRGRFFSKTLNSYGPQLLKGTSVCSFSVCKRHERHNRCFIYLYILMFVLFSFNRCFECKEELSTHCNKKALAQTLDFLQKHSAKATSGIYSTGKQAKCDLSLIIEKHLFFHLRIVVSDSHSRYCGDSSLIEADSSLKFKTWKSPCFPVLWGAQIRADFS